MLHIRLGDEDRERLGVTEEWIEFDPDKLTLSEAEILDDHGLNWFEIRAGEPVPDENGQPRRSRETGQELVRYRPRVQRVWVWAALRRAGIRVDFAELDYDFDAVIYRQTDPDAPGKGDGSETSAESTQSSSPGSGDGTPETPSA